MLRSLLALALLAAPAFADGPGDNVPDNVRRIPPPGLAVPDEVKQALTPGLEKLGAAIRQLEQGLANKPALRELLPDVEIYHKAVDWALRYGEFFEVKEFDAAQRLLAQGQERAAALANGKAPWTSATGLIVRGYRSRIDGSVQPYGLIVPASYRPDLPTRYRLDVWWHGRGEKLSELAFIDQRQKSVGEFAPAGAFVLHAYGRYCNANKFAGEVDTFEALEHAKKHYAIDDNRLVARGFSMGGAACWQFAAHYPDVWCAAAPGAGFAESAEFLNVFQSEKVAPPAWERTLWRWYDATEYAANFANLPTVAYSGENDRQKQAADIMAKALKAERLELTHLIGPKTGHSYHPQTKAEINRRIDLLATVGRPRLPREVRFTTPTLRYHRCYWLRLDGLAKHWEKATATGTFNNGFTVKTENVTALTLLLEPGQLQWSLGTPVAVELDGQKLDGGSAPSDRSYVGHFVRDAGRWRKADRPGVDGLAKRPGLQGPIDEAFCDRFLMVRPTGTPMHEATGTWAKAELAHALTHWRQQFRGDAPVKDDTAVTEADLAASNLILWGDPKSNAVLAKLADRLPVRWQGNELIVGASRYPADSHVPALVFPNPLNPTKYVVLNSGFTYREYDYLNNARQVPKLPDYAVFDIRQPANARYAGKVVAAGFFDERWKFQ